MATTQQQATYTDASTQRVTAESGIEYAYRDVGDGDVPLVLLQHFRGNLDNWDPALIDDLAADRRVITFDNVGVGGTTGISAPGLNGDMGISCPSPSAFLSPVWKSCCTYGFFE